MKKKENKPKPTAIQKKSMKEFQKSIDILEKMKNPDTAIFSVFRNAKSKCFGAILSGDADEMKGLFRNIMSSEPGLREIMLLAITEDIVK